MALLENADFLKKHKIDFLLGVAGFNHKKGVWYALDEDNNEHEFTYLGPLRYCDRSKTYLVRFTTANPYAKPGQLSVVMHDFESDWLRKY